MNLNIPQSLASAAFSGVSWNPEDRGRRTVDGFESEVAADIAKLTEQAQKGGTMDLLDEQIARYRAGFRQRAVAWLNSESRCVSWVIAGPSNFPIQRMNKRSEIARRRLDELYDYRKRALDAAIKVLRPDLRPIMSGDSDAVERLQEEIDKAEAVRDKMKAANVAIRKNAKQGEAAQVAALVALGFSEPRARDLLQPDCCGRIGFADYQLSNSGANLRRMKERLETLKASKAAPVQSVEANGITLEDDPPANRVRLFFPGKPDVSVRDKLKAAGFRWAPSIGAWQAYRNWRAMELAKSFVKEEA